MNRDSEKYLERTLCAEVKKMGGVAYKFVSPGHRGVPDRICVLPNGFIMFVELKSKGKKPSPLQELEIARIKSLGGHVSVVDSYTFLLFVLSVMRAYSNTSETC